MSYIVYNSKVSLQTKYQGVQKISANRGSAVCILDFHQVIGPTAFELPGLPGVLSIWDVSIIL